MFIFSACGIMSLVLVPGIGVRRNDALRWIKLGGASGIQFQPSEIMKVCIIVLLAYLICKKGEEIKKFWNGIIPIAFSLIPVAGLLVVQEHLSAMMIITVITACMLIVGGARFIHLLPIGLGGVGAIIAYALSSPFRLKRILLFMDPWQDTLGGGWQIIQSLYAIASGGVLGVGPGMGVQKYMYISEPHNDFILATWAEETGLIGVTIVLILFGLLIWRGIRISIKSEDKFGSLVAVGITSMIGIQAIFNIAVVSSSMPVTGISLPFCSYGGSSLIILLVACGIILSISRLNTNDKIEE